MYHALSECKGELKSKRQGGHGRPCPPRKLVHHPHHAALTCSSSTSSWAQAPCRDAPRISIARRQCAASAPRPHSEPKHRTGTQHLPRHLQTISACAVLDRPRETLERLSGAHLRYAIYCNGSQDSLTGSSARRLVLSASSHADQRNHDFQVKISSMASASMRSADIPTSRKVSANTGRRRARATLPRESPSARGRGRSRRHSKSTTNRVCIRSGMPVEMRNLTISPRSFPRNQLSGARETCPRVQSGPGRLRRAQESLRWTSGQSLLHKIQEAPYAHLGPPVYIRWIPPSFPCPTMPDPVRVCLPTRIADLPSLDWAHTTRPSLHLAARGKPGSSPGTEPEGILVSGPPGRAVGFHSLRLQIGLQRHLGPEMEGQGARA